MQLVLVAHRSGASFEVADVAVVVGNDEGTLKLSRAERIDAEIAAQFHRAAHAFRDIDEGAVGEYGGVECGEKVIAIGHDSAYIAAHEVGMLLYGLAYRAEDNALLAQLVLESCLHGDGVHDGIDSRVAAQGEPFLKGNTQLVESLFQLRVDGWRTVVAFLGLLLCQRVGIVGYVLIVDGRQMEVSPGGSRLLLPIAEGLEAKLKHPFRLVLLCRNEPHDIFVDTFLYNIRLHIGGEAIFIFLLRHLAYKLIAFFRHNDNYLNRRTFNTFCLLRGFRQKDIKTYFFLFSISISPPPPLGRGWGWAVEGAVGGSLPLNLPYSIGPQILIAARELMLSEPSSAVCR